MVEDRRVVLDASALLAWLFKERGGDVIEQVLPYGVIPLPNLAEVLVISARRGFAMDSEGLRERIVAYGVSVEAPAVGDEIRAAELIVHSYARRAELGGTVSLGDGLCIAVAERLGLPISSGDRLWTKLPLKVPYQPFR
ncbi:MAG TPA: PIN domain-containing protein [Pseudonocardiaceae bacterium]|jgi:PIN domain nuclease of toxin-antitoxin system|nr:PIN domain-containing protein [Pseudonocardiaceae bacterium]